MEKESNPYVWERLDRIPVRFALLFLLYPLSWPALLVGLGVRKQMIGREDLLAVAMIGFSFAAVIMSLLSFEFCRRWKAAIHLRTNFG